MPPPRLSSVSSQPQPTSLTWARDKCDRTYGFVNSADGLLCRHRLKPIGGAADGAGQRPQRFDAAGSVERRLDGLLARKNVRKTRDVGGQCEPAFDSRQKS